MGRTEDIQFSPDHRLLAVSGYRNDAVYLFSTYVARENGTKTLEIRNYAVIRSSCLKEPHGVAFLGMKYLIVANRAGALNILRVPDLGETDAEVALEPVAEIRGNVWGRVETPGSVAVMEGDNGSHRILVCNNYIHTVTAHRLGLTDKLEVKNEGVLIRRGLSIPDGIRVSPDRRCVAVSNHSTGTVLLYGLGPGLNRRTAPFAALHGIVCPHALRFSEDGAVVFVADSASPYLHIYERPGEDWRSMAGPSRSFRVLDEETFRRGRYNAQEGGTKGIDIHDRARVLAATSEHQPLAFYDLDAVMRTGPSAIDDEIARMSLERDRELARLRPRPLPWSVGRAAPAAGAPRRGG